MAASLSVHADECLAVDLADTPHVVVCTACTGSSGRAWAEEIHTDQAQTPREEEEEEKVKRSAQFASFLQSSSPFCLQSVCLSSFLLLCC